MSWKAAVPVVLAVIALATALVERDKAQFYIESGSYSDDYINLLTTQLAKCEVGCEP